MANGGRPKCPVEGCDGDLYREFITGLNRSTAQTMRLVGLGLIIAPILFAAPFLLDAVVHGPFGMSAVLTIALVVIAIIAGSLLLRYRSQRLAERSEQHRCNVCGTVFPVGSGTGGA